MLISDGRAKPSSSTAGIVRVEYHLRDIAGVDKALTQYPRIISPHHKRADRKSIIRRAFNGNALVQAVVLW